MNNQYSVTKGIWKGVGAIITAAIMLTAFAGFSDITLWGLLEQYLKPLLGSLTLTGVLIFAKNWVKFHTA